MLSPALSAISARTEPSGLRYGAKSAPMRRSSVRSLTRPAALLGHATVGDVGHLVEDAGQVLGQRRPREALAGVAPGPAAAAAPLDRIAERLDQRAGQRGLVVGRDQPASRAVGDDVGRAEAVDGDRRQPAGHALDEHRPELLAHRGQDVDVGRRQERRQLVVAVPAGEEDVARARGGDRVGGMLALPLAGIAAEQDQRRVGRQPAFALGARPRADQQPDALDRGEAADADRHGAARQRRDLGLGVADRALVLARRPAARATPRGGGANGRRGRPRARRSARGQSRWG